MCYLQACMYTPFSPEILPAVAVKGLTGTLISCLPETVQFTGDSSAAMLQLPPDLSSAGSANLVRC